MDINGREQVGVSLTVKEYETLVTKALDRNVPVSTYMRGIVMQAINDGYADNVPDNVILSRPVGRRARRIRAVQELIEA